MGGLIVNLFSALNVSKEIAGVISSAAATNFLPMIRPLRFIPYKLISFKTVKNNCEGLLAFDQNVEKAYKEDKLVLKEYKISLIGAMFIDGVSALLKNVQNIQTAFLYLHGREDKLVPYECSKNMYEKISSRDKELHIIEGSKHEIFNDYKKEEAIAYLIKWINKS